MMRACLAVALATLAPPVMADDICDDLWFTRNLIFDRAGYCFGSALGESVFGNEGCTTKEPVIGGDDQYLIADVLWREDALGCAVDTSRTTLDVDQEKLRRQMPDQPVRSVGESACIGWTGTRMPLRGARDEIAPLTGAVRTGDTLLFRYDDRRGWSFVEVTQNGVGAGAGWARIEITEASCEALAG